MTFSKPLFWFLTTTCERIYPNVLAWGIWNWGREIFFSSSSKGLPKKIWLGTPTDFQKLLMYLYFFFFLPEYNTHRKSNRLEKKNIKLEGWREKCKSTACSATAPPPPSSVNSVAALILPTYFWKIEKQNKNNKNSKARKKKMMMMMMKEKKRKKKGSWERAKNIKRKTQKWIEGRCLRNVEKQNCSG